MKKSSIFFVSVISIALLSGCAKERDNYDKYLTDGTWTMTSIEERGNEVETFDYVLAGIPTRTVTTQQSGTYADGKVTSVNYHQTTYVPGATTYTRATKVGTYSISFKFNKDGTYERSSTSKNQSTQNDTELGNGPVVYVAEAERTSAQSNLWYWMNTTETKKQINLNGQMFDVSINKNNFSITLNVSGTKTENGTDGTGDYVKTSDFSERATYRFSK